MEIKMTVEETIREGNTLLLESFQKGNPTITWDQVMSVTEEVEYQSFLWGYLLAKGLADPIIDCSKETNRGSIAL